MDGVWTSFPVTDPDDPPRQPWLDAEAEIKRLREAVATVAVEGPVAVADAAHELWVACYDALHEANDLSGTHAGDGSQRLFELAAASGTTVEANRHAARGAFIGAARGAVGGNSPGFG
jgi:hypothetical protein